MRIDIVTALPALAAEPLEHSIIGRARRKGLVDIRVHDLRAFATDKHRQVDDYPFGGAAGMVLKPEPIFACIESLCEEGVRTGLPVEEVIFMTPDGAVFNQGLANRLSLRRRIVILAGHYKGVDHRVREALVTLEVSIGDYVLSGGELPALVVADALVRLVPGVLGDAASALSDSFQDALLDAPVYTRPAEFRGMKAPEVLLSGDHARVAAWTEAEKLRRTQQLRPDLLAETPQAAQADPTALPAKPTNEHRDI